MYDRRSKEDPAMPARKLITISLPPPLLKQAEAVAREEHRTKSELVREALRFYVETRTIRKETTRERIAPLLARVDARARRAPAPAIRRAIREAVGAVRQESRQPRA
jgi:metal-responsive CopG/Arc/MetJ family transcriptional regulator